MVTAAGASTRWVQPGLRVAAAPPGVDVVLRGLSMTLDVDEVLAVTSPVFGALQTCSTRSLLHGKDAPA